jgi:6-pyruvoyl-tetrahydropterin synthase
LQKHGKDKMRITRSQLRKLISETINEMDNMQSNMAAAQRSYDDQQHPDYYSKDRPSENASEADIFEYAIENLFDNLVDAAVDEQVITEEEAETMTDEELVAVLKSNFKSDIYEDNYDEYISNSDTVDYFDRDRNSDY